MSGVFLIALSGASVAACDGPTPTDAGPPEVDAGPEYPAECENLNPTHCVLPWPSSRFLVDDPGTVTGRRIEVPEAAMPANRSGTHISPEILGRFDGFSPMTQVMTSFPGLIDPAGLNGEDAIGSTLEEDSTTVLLDTETGERVAHFAELDTWDETAPDRAPLYIRPAARLEEGRRYIVAIRGLRHLDGSAVTASPYFAALRDGNSLAEAGDLEGRRAHFDDLFAELEAAGIGRGDLLEAWDFETSSGESLWGDLLAMRDAALEQVGDDGLGCTVTSVEEGEDTPDDVYRYVHGTFTMPLFLDDPEGVELQRDASGTPVAATTYEAPFLVLIPRSVEASVRGGGAPGRMLTYGHGIVSRRQEVQTGWHRDHAERLQMVSVATDFIGLTEDDLGTLFSALRDGNRFPDVPARLSQGVLNTLVLTRSFIGSCASLPELQLEVDGGGAAPAYDPAERYYYGNSMGGALGTTLAALSTDIERFVLGVNGVSFPTFVKRSVQWNAYGPVVRGGYPDPLVADLTLVMLANLWDLIEASTYSPHLLRDPLPGTGVKRILMQIGQYDAVLANITSDMQARTIPLPVLTPDSVYRPYGLETTAGPVDSAFIAYDVGAPALPLGTTNPVVDTDAHEGVRRVDSALEQIDRFLRPDGQVEATCDGPCDPD